MLADFSFGLPVTKVEEKTEEKKEEIGNDIEVRVAHANAKYTPQINLFIFVDS